MSSRLKYLLRLWCFKLLYPTWSLVPSVAFLRCQTWINSWQSCWEEARPCGWVLPKAFGCEPILLNAFIQRVETLIARSHPSDFSLVRHEDGQLFLQVEWHCYCESGWKCDTECCVDLLRNDDPNQKHQSHLNANRSTVATSLLETFWPMQPHSMKAILVLRWHLCSHNEMVSILLMPSTWRWKVTFFHSLQISHCSLIFCVHAQSQTMDLSWPPNASSLQQLTHALQTGTETEDVGWGTEIPGCNRRSREDNQWTSGATIQSFDELIISCYALCMKESQLLSSPNHCLLLMLLPALSNHYSHDPHICDHCSFLRLARVIATPPWDWSGDCNSSLRLVWDRHSSSRLVQDHDSSLHLVRDRHSSLDWSRVHSSLRLVQDHHSSWRLVLAMCGCSHTFEAFIAHLWLFPDEYCLTHENTASWNDWMNVGWNEVALMGRSACPKPAGLSWIWQYGQHVQCGSWDDPSMNHQVKKGKKSLLFSKSAFSQGWRENRNEFLWNQVGIGWNEVARW